jgi:hypothetical protein
MNLSVFLRFYTDYGTHMAVSKMQQFGYFCDVGAGKNDEGLLPIL